MPSVVIYARVSTEDGQDPAAQVRTCRVYADLRGYTVQQVYEDRASALNFRGRKAWRAMLQDLKRWAPRTRPKGILAYALEPRGPLPHGLRQHHRATKGAGR